MNALTLYITRDLINGEILNVELVQEDAEFDCALWVGTHLTLRTGETVTADPQLEVHRVRLDKPAEVIRAATCRRRYRQRKAREDREFETWQQMRTAIKEGRV